MRFRYPLQKIVDLKGSQKSMAEWEYAAALSRLREEEERLQALLQERSRTEERFARTASAPVPLAELTALQQYLDALDGRIRSQMNDVENAESHVQARRRKLTERSVDEKVWQGARDKALQTFLRESLAKQQHELDEMATNRAAAAARG